MSLIANAKKKSMNQFMNEAKATSCKYMSSPNTTDVIYFVPMTYTEETNQGKQEVTEVNSLKLFLHDYKEDGKFYKTACTADYHRSEGESVLNDGSCAFCERTKDSWEVYNLQLEQLKEKARANGEDPEEAVKNVKKQLVEERKAKNREPRVYALIAVLKMKDKKNPEVDEKGTPIFELKVMSLSNKRFDKFKEIADESDSTVHASEFRITYPDLEDIGARTSQSTISLANNKNNLIVNNKELMDAIADKVKDWDWESIKKDFQELKELTTTEQRAKVNQLLSAFDEYKEQLKTNPNAKYLSFPTNSTSTPAIGTTAVNPAIDVNSDPNAAFEDIEI